MYLIAKSNFPRACIAQIPFLHRYLYPTSSLLIDEQYTDNLDFVSLLANRNDIMNLNCDLRHEIQQLNTQINDLNGSYAQIGEQLNASLVRIQGLTAHILQVESQLGASRIELFSARDRLSRYQEIQALLVRRRVHDQLIACWHPPSSRVPMLEEQIRSGGLTIWDDDDIIAECEESRVIHDGDENICPTSPRRSSFRELIMQLAQETENQDGAIRFYQMALLRLKEERRLNVQSQVQRKETAQHLEQHLSKRTNLTTTPSRDFQLQCIRRLNRDRSLCHTPCFQPRSSQSIASEMGPTSSSTSTLSVADDNEDLSNDLETCPV